MTVIFKAETDFAHIRGRTVTTLTFAPLHPFYSEIKMDASYTFEIEGVRYTGCRPKRMEDGSISFDLTNVAKIKIGRDS